MKEAFLIGEEKFMERKKYFWLVDTQRNKRIETKNIAWLYSLDSSFRRLRFKPIVAFSVLARYSPDRVSSFALLFRGDSLSEGCY